MIITVTPNPCVDKTFEVDTLEAGKKHVALECSAIAGGKGVNVSRAAKLLGMETRAIVLVAGTTGEEVLRMIGGDGVQSVPVWTNGLTRTITTVLERSVHRQTPLFEAGPGITSAARSAFSEAVKRFAGPDTIITFNGTIPDPEAQDLYSGLIPLAQKKGATIFLDSHGPPFREAIALKPHWAKPNVEELSQWAGAALDTETKQWEAMERLQDGGVEQVILSRGAQGALALTREGRFRITPPPIKEVNPVGSGDCFVAGFCVGLLQQQTIVQCLRRATACGAANAAAWEIGHFDPATLPDYEAATQVDAL